MSAPLAYNRSADQEAQKRCLLTMFDVAPVTKNDRKARLGYASRLLGYPVESMALGKMTAKEFNALRGELLNLKECPEVAETTFAESVPLRPVIADPDELEEIIASLEECRDLGLRLYWLKADRLAKGYTRAVRLGLDLDSEMARLAKVLGVKLPTALRWVAVSRYVPEADRDLYPQHAWQVFEVAAATWGVDEIPSTAAVRERLELAADSGWGAAGLLRHLLGPQERVETTPANERLKAKVKALADEGRLDEGWDGIRSAYVVKDRKVAQ